MVSCVHARINGEQIPARSRKAIIKEKILFLVQKIGTIAKFIFITLGSVLLYLANPSLFALGFLVGFIIDERVRHTVEKAKQFCLTKPWIVPIVVVGSFLALPVAIASSSFICGAYLSSKLAGMVPDEYKPNV